MSNKALEKPERIDKRIHVALPIRVTYWDKNHRACLELACTYDISARGARITGLRCVKDVGEIIAIERGRSKSFCRVVWIGESNSELQGQVGLQCVESERTMWDAELRDMQEVYDPILRESALFRVGGGVNLNGNRRRYQRFGAAGEAELLGQDAKARQIQAALKDLSEMGCMVKSKTLMLPGTDLKLVLNVGSYDLCLKGQVRHAALDVGVGIEFREVRKGDRPVLQYLIRKMAEQQLPDEKPKQRAAVVCL